MLKMIDAFSYASEYWEVGLCVKASNLPQVSIHPIPAIPVSTASHPVLFPTRPRVL